MNYLKKIKEVVLLCSANLFTGTLSLAGKIIPVKVGCLHYNRAHLIVNTEYWLRTHQPPPRGVYVFISGRKPWNRQVLEMIKRKVFVLENDFLFRLFSAFQQRKPKSDVWVPLNDSGHFRWKEWNSAPPQLVLNQQEQDGGRQNLKKMGIGENEPVVCFYCRDDRYLDESIANYDWGYHRYRNTNIENYLKAMEWLVAKGYRALRMGALVQRPLTTKSVRVMDYASRCRSDFMDVFLFSYCRFSVGDTAGTICLPNTFHTPVVFVNSVPLAYPARNKNGLTIPKKLMDKRKGRFLTFRQIFKNGMDMWLDGKYYEEAGIEAIENSPQEIADVVMEMHLRLEGQWEPASEDERLQERFRAVIPDGHPLKGFPSRIGAAFLRNNQDLLE